MLDRTRCIDQMSCNTSPPFSQSSGQKHRHTVLAYSIDQAIITVHCFLIMIGQFFSDLMWLTRIHNTQTIKQTKILHLINRKMTQFVVKPVTELMQN
jgi:hypothetical protein